MLKIPKKQLYNPLGLLNLSRNAFSLKKILIISCFCVLYIWLPFYLIAYLKLLSFKMLPAFYLTILFICVYLYHRYSKLTYQLDLKIQKLQEKLNIADDQNTQYTKNTITTQERRQRFHSLKTILEKINQNLSVDYISNNLTEIIFSLIAKNRGLCLLYLVDNQTQKLSLFKAKKENKNLVVRSKEGDIFDAWVLKHASPLIIEDARKDFRFDLEKSEELDTRPVLSLISSPLISESKFLGILRLDNASPHFYSQDDLRLLVAIADIGAVALENGELFQKTQEFAIHDALTSLYTKAYFFERLKQECRRNIRAKNSLSLLMIDIDFFKNYNDKYGHIAGDIVLKNLSFYILDFLKELNPIISRFGGEEFCVLLPGVNKGDARNIAEELCRRIEKSTITLRRQKTGITVSIGISSLPDDAVTEDDLIRRADAAMYEAKQKGRNKVICA